MFKSVNRHNGPLFGKSGKSSPPKPSALPPAPPKSASLPAVSPPPPPPPPAPAGQGGGHVVVLQTAYLMDRIAPADGIDLELACGLALGLYQSDKVTVTPDTVTTVHPETKAPVARAGWLDLGDRLGRLTKEFLDLKAKAAGSSPASAGSPADRARLQRVQDDFLLRMTEVRTEAAGLLKQAGTADRARKMGMKVLGE